jgi:16S rRNA (uracil1498-N3)-methyltransferase
MPDFRVFCEPATLEPAEIRLDQAEAHHLVQVCRARQGDTVVAFDGRGNEWVSTLVYCGKLEAVLKVTQHLRQKPLPYSIALGQALPKGKSMDSIVRKATEIGVRQIIPLESERTEVHVAGDREEHKKGKWLSIAIEAAKQCGNPFLPEVMPVQRAAEFMENAKGYDLKLIASLHPGAVSLRNVLAEYRQEHGSFPSNVLWLIGPEGDFTPAEISLSQTHGFRPIGLGPLVLRCETAAIVALSILSYELQNP